MTGGIPCHRTRQSCVINFPNIKKDQLRNFSLYKLPIYKLEGRGWEKKDATHITIKKQMPQCDLRALKTKSQVVLH
jgi:hypothetical protein